MMRTLFLHPPSFDGFDGGAGSRYQARREVRSFWYPTWLAQPAALVPGSKLIDAPAAGVSLAEVLPLAREYDLAVLHTSSPSFPGDVRVAEALKRENPALRVGFVGAKVAVEPEESLLASPVIDFVAREEFDFTIAEIAEGRPLETVDGVTFRDANGRVVHTPDRAILEDMDRLPFVTEVYKRDLRVEDYFIGYLKHPYVSLYTGRGCRSKCTFCLWPQTVGGHRYRTRSPEHVLEEVALIPKYFPQVKEVFFDDDTFTDDAPRAETIARGLGTTRHHLVLQCEGECLIRDTKGAPRQRPALAAGRLRIRQSANPQQHQEGAPSRHRAPVHARLSHAWHHHSRHVHPRLAGRDAGNHPRDNRVREGDQSAHHPGVYRGAVPRHVSLQAGQGQRMDAG